MIARRPGRHRGESWMIGYGADETGRGYFAEGGREGHTKFQGELETYLSGSAALDVDRARARESLAMLAAADG